MNVVQRIHTASRRLWGIGPEAQCLNIANGRIADILSRNMNWPNKHGLTRFDRIGCESSKELRHEAPVDQLHYWKDVTERSAYEKKFPECALARATT